MNTSSTSSHALLVRLLAGELDVSAIRVCSLEKTMQELEELLDYEDREQQSWSNPEIGDFWFADTVLFHKWVQVLRFKSGTAQSDGNSPALLPVT